MAKNRFVRSSWPAVLLLLALAAAAKAPAPLPRLFFTSDRCVACHNGIVTAQGEDISFGTSWRPSMMANSARDPYWQASVRRETLVPTKMRDEMSGLARRGEHGLAVLERHRRAIKEKSLAHGVSSVKCASASSRPVI